MSPLVRWRTEERERLFTQLPHCDTRALCSPTSFPKVGTESMREFLRRWIHAPRCLGDLIVKDGPYSLVIPKTAGYYVAAYEDEMARTKQMLLSFGSVSDSDLALVLLNSNAYFWFWRTFGDGFDVTKGIIEGCPVFTPGDGSFRDIARALRDAIPDCTVYKGYRGKKVPNVNFNLRMDLLWQADEWIIQHVAPDLGITPLDFVWAKSNSFLSLCVPKSANWPDGCEPCDVDGEYDDDEEQ